MIKSLSMRYGKFINGNAYDFVKQSYTLICDYCGKAIPRFENFIDAVNYKKDNGWKSIKTPNKWADMCCECINKYKK